MTSPTKNVLTGGYVHINEGLAEDFVMQAVHAAAQRDHWESALDYIGQNWALALVAEAGQTVGTTAASSISYVRLKAVSAERAAVRLIERQEREHADGAAAMVDAQGLNG